MAANCLCVVLAAFWSEAALTFCRGRSRAELLRTGLCALAVVAVGVAMVVVGSGNDGAVELLSSHHTQIRTGLEEAKAIEAASARKDSDRLAELSKLAAAASKPASQHEHHLLVSRLLVAWIARQHAYASLEGQTQGTNERHDSTPPE